MGLFSGKSGSIRYDVGGVATTVIDCTGWTMDRTVELQEYAACSTNGNYANIPGNVRATGNLTGYTDDTAHISSFFDVGDEILLYLYLNATRFHQVPAIIESVSEEVQVEQGSLVGWQATYKNQGSWLLWQI